MSSTSAERPAGTSVEGLYRWYARDVFRLAYRSVRSRPEAEDLTQTTFLNAHRALMRGARPEDDRAWLLAIARNVCHSSFRDRRRHPWQVALDESLPAPAEGADESAQEVIAALRELPPRQRVALALHSSGCSAAEIGGRLEIAPAAVDALLFRARAALRDCLEEKAVEFPCGRTEPLVLRQLGGDAEDGERAALRAHLRSCPACATRARRLRATRRLGSLLALPWELGGRLAGLLGSGGAAAKGAALVGAVAIGTTVVAAQEQPSFAPGTRGHAPVTTPAPARPVSGSPLRATGSHDASAPVRGIHTRAAGVLPVAIDSAATVPARGETAVPETAVPDVPTAHPVPAAPVEAAAPPGGTAGASGAPGPAGRAAPSGETQNEGTAATHVDATVGLLGREAGVTADAALGTGGAAVTAAVELPVETSVEVSLAAATPAGTALTIGAQAPGGAVGVGLTLPALPLPNLTLPAVAVPALGFLPVG